MTDRFTTRLDDLAIGPYTLALFDRGTGRVTRVPGFEGAKHLNPQWTPDGSSLYFVADPGGIPDIYRVRLADGELRQVTNLFTGASGITETSPAFSVALRSGRLAYSVFRTNGYELYAVDSADVLAGRPAVPPAEPVAAVPAAGRTRERYAGERPERSRHGPAWRHDVRDAAVPARIRPHRRGTAGVGGGTGEFGTYVGGGASLYFTDELGNRNLVTGLQVNGGFKDISGIVAYANMAHRVNWGAVIQQVPYLTGQFAAGVTEVNGEPLYVEQQLVQRQTNRDLQGFITYPFNTAQRVELTRRRHQHHLRQRAADAGLFGHGRAGPGHEAESARG